MGVGEFVAETRDAEKTRQVVAVRDSKDPDGPKLFLSVDAWDVMLERIKKGELELPDHMRESLDPRFR